MTWKHHHNDGNRLNEPTAHNKHNSSNKKKQNNNNHLTTSPVLHDVWVDVIGPKLNAADIVTLSMVSRWGRHTARNILHHQGYAKTKPDLQACQNATKHWPFLKIKLELCEWKQQQHHHHQQQNHHHHHHQQQQQHDHDHDHEDLDHNHNNASTNTTNINTTHDMMVASFAPCRIASLKLPWCQISDFGFVDPAGLEQLCLIGPKMDSKAQQSLTALLSSCKCLSSLRLSDCIKEHEDITWLVTGLENLPPQQLVHLDLELNRLGADRIKKIVPALSRMHKLKKLLLSLNEIGPDGTFYVAQAIRDMRGLTELGYSFNRMGAEGATYFATSLSNMPHLTSLNLFANDMGVGGVKCLLVPLTHMARLTHLTLGWNGLDDVTKRTVTETLLNVHELRL